jgi:hypothetical protein
MWGANVVVGGLLYMIGAFGMGDNGHSRSRGGGESDIERLERLESGTGYIDPINDPRFWEK